MIYGASVSKETLNKRTPPTPVDVDRTPVAQDIWCYNNQQKAFTWHVVVNHDASGYVDRVQCKTTGTVRKYRRQHKGAVSAPQKKTPVIRRNALGQLVASKRVARTTNAEKSASLEQIWFEGIKNWGDKDIVTYTPTKFFKLKDVLDHPSFGKGVVQTKRDNKIDVLFRMGMKTLQSTTIEN